jgi:hypothetical protein
MNDTTVFTQNVQRMERMDHKRKLSQQERKMDQEARDLNLLLFSESLPTNLPTAPLKTRRVKRTRQQYRTHSPITIPGTPDPKDSTPSKRPSRCPLPNYEHRNTNYKQPPLIERIRIGDLLDDKLLLSMTRLHNGFDFSTDGFPNELYRVGGVKMVKEYERRKDDEALNGDTSEDSTSSLKIYEKAYASDKPECGESNAESAERHRLLVIEQRVLELKHQRGRQKDKKTPKRISTQFTTDPKFTHTIDNKQRRTTERRKRLSKEKTTVRDLV